MPPDLFPTRPVAQMERQGVFIVIYGVPGSAKTTIAGQVVLSPFGSPAYDADMEGGAESIRSLVGVEIPPLGQEINTWDRLTSLIDRFHGAPKGAIRHKSLLIDNASETLSMWQDKHLPGAKQMEIQHWGAYYRDMLSLTRKLRDISRKQRVNIIMTAWELPRENSSGQVYKHDLDFNPQLARRFPGLVDIVGYLTVIGPTKRELSFQAHPRTAAKFRRSVNYADVYSIPDILRFTLEDAPIADLVSTLQGGLPFPDKYAKRLGKNAKPTIPSGNAIIVEGDAEADNEGEHDPIGDGPEDSNKASAS